MISIFVAKLDFGVSNEELKSIFEQYGKVNKATVATDRETGKPRGFAFVEMPDENEAQAAIDALDGFEINGRTIAVKQAEDRGSSPRPAAGSPRPFQPRENRPAREGSESTPPYRDRETIKPVDPDIIIKAPDKSAKNKKDRDRLESKSDSKKAKKMEAYKKSGKDRIVFDDDDDDDYFPLHGNSNDFFDDEEE